MEIDFHSIWMKAGGVEVRQFERERENGEKRKTSEFRNVARYKVNI